MTQAQCTVETSRKNYEAHVPLSRVLSFSKLSGLSFSDENGTSVNKPLDARSRRGFFTLEAEIMGISAASFEAGYINDVLDSKTKLCGG